MWGGLQSERLLKSQGYYFPEVAGNVTFSTLQAVT